MGFFMRLRLRGAPVGSYPTFSPLLAGLVVSGRLSVVGQISPELRANRRLSAFFPTPVSFFLLATENRLLTTSPAGGLFSVTLSVTWDSHPKYPRFHKACCPSVFGLSSGEKFTPAITCHSRQGYHREGWRSTFGDQRSTFRGALWSSFSFVPDLSRSSIVLVLGFLPRWRGRV
jgi:hypothetical protein